MTISITQEHPASLKTIDMHSVDNLFMRGKRVELPDALRFAKQRYDVTVHQTFSCDDERNPTITYSIKKKTEHDATYTVTVQHKVYTARLHSLRCTISCDASDGFAAHTFSDIDKPHNITSEIDSLFYKAFTHDIVSEAFIDDALDYTLRGMNEAEQQNAPLLNAVCLN